MIGAISTWLYMFQASGFGANSEYRFLDMMPVATMIAVSTASLMLVSLVTRPPDKEHLARFFKSL